MYTVQQVARLFGEHIAETEIMLNEIAGAYESQTVGKRLRQGILGRPRAFSGLSRAFLRRVLCFLGRFHAGFRPADRAPGGLEVALGVLGLFERGAAFLLHRGELQFEADVLPDELDDAVIGLLDVPLDPVGLLHELRHVAQDDFGGRHVRRLRFLHDLLHDRGHERLGKGREERPEGSFQTRPGGVRVGGGIGKTRIPGRLPLRPFHDLGPPVDEHAGEEPRAADESGEGVEPLGERPHGKHANDLHAGSVLPQGLEFDLGAHCGRVHHFLLQPFPEDGKVLRIRPESGGEIRLVAEHELEGVGRDPVDFREEGVADVFGKRQVVVKHGSPFASGVCLKPAVDASRSSRKDGASGGDRTHNLQLRRLTLCPIELQTQNAAKVTRIPAKSKEKMRRGGRRAIPPADC